MVARAHTLIMLYQVKDDEKITTSIFCLIGIVVIYKQFSVCLAAFLTTFVWVLDKSIL